MPIFRLFENVVPADRAIVRTITESLNIGAPFLVNAADFGWTDRKRLIWCDAFWPYEFREFASDSSYEAKGWIQVTIPRRRRLLPDIGAIFKSPFKPSHLVNRGTAGHPEGRMPVVTRLLDGQPPHGYQRASSSARERCHSDGKVLPYYWYEDGALLWKESTTGTMEWRRPNVGEVELLMGLPP